MVIADVQKLNTVSAASFEKMILGVTTYVWECLLTGEVRTREVLGTDVPMLDELMLKARQYGRQVISDEGGRRFILEQLNEQQPIVDVKDLPIRKPN